MSFPSISMDFFRIYCALVQRDFLMIKQRYKGAITDAVVQLVIVVLIFGSLFPLMGVPITFIAPLYLGTQVMNILFSGMGFGFRIIFDIRYSRFIDYRLTLPLPKRWLFASYITYFMMETSIILLPLLTVGIFLLGPRFTMIDPHLWFFIPMYVMILCFYGLLTLGLSFHYEYDWFMQNVWQRRISPLIALAPFFFTWQSAYNFSPKFAYLMLANPFTYTAEGMRAIFIGGSSFISMYVCLVALIFWIIAGIIFVSYSIAQRLDPV